MTANRNAALLETLSGTAKVWVYASDRPLETNEQKTILDQLRVFMSSWTSHERAVRGEAVFEGSRVLILGAEIPKGQISGCGIDKSTRVLGDLGLRLGFGWLNSLQILYQDASGAEHVATRSEFRRLAMQERVDVDTPVLRMSPESLGDLRRTGAFIEAGRSWHQAVFSVEVTETVNKV